MTEAFIGGLVGSVVGLFGMGIGLGIIERRRTAEMREAIESAKARIADQIGLVVMSLDDDRAEPTDPTEVN